MPGAAAVARRTVRKVGGPFDRGPTGADGIPLDSALVAKRRLDPCNDADAAAPPTEATPGRYRVCDEMFRRD